MRVRQMGNRKKRGWGWFIQPTQAVCESGALVSEESGEGREEEGCAGEETQTQADTDT